MKEQTSPTFTREPFADGKFIYRLDDDPRFSIEPDLKGGLLGTGNMVFGQIPYGDGSSKIVGWSIRVEGSRKRFAPGKLSELKAKLADTDYRAWAISRAQEA